MSNETKRNVFEKLLSEYVDDELRIDGLVYEPDQHIGELDREYFTTSYDAALPDDLPVIPKAVGEYIEKVKAHGKRSIIDPLWRVGDSLTAVGESGLGDLTRWVLHHSDDFARAWLLGVWRVEETGEIVKLEAEK